jgi:fluoride exporter
MGQFLWICLGGAVGTGARYALTSWSREVLGASFPYGTLAVNVIGSFLLGMIMYIGLKTDLLSPTLRMTLGTGVMGGFTTYSTFNYETVQFFQDRAVRLGLINILGTFFGCFIAGLLGLAMAKRLVG